MPPAKSSHLVRAFYPALDGLRAVAFLMVFAVHYVTLVSSRHIFAWGWVGVDVFFVISGFLITGILFDSLDKKSYFSGFYIRRSLRIFPLYYVFWLTLLLATPLLHVDWNRYVVALAFYAGNFFIPGAGQGFHVTPATVTFHSLLQPGTLDRIQVGHFWSLCVEEQFYLVWPLVVWLVPSRKALLRICLGVIVLMPFARYAYAVLHPEMVEQGGLYFITYFRMDTLLAGAALALWLRGPALSPARIRKISNVTIVAASALLLVIHHLERVHAAFTNIDFDVNTIGFTLVAAASAGLLLLSIDPETFVYRVLRVRPLASFGRISYGMYIFHGLPMYYFRDHLEQLSARHLGWLMPIMALAVTYVLARLSFRFIESPFLRLKDRFARRSGGADPQPVPRVNSERFAA